MQKQKCDNPVVFVIKFAAALGVALWALITLPFTLRVPKAEPEWEIQELEPVEPREPRPVQVDMTPYEPSREVLCGRGDLPQKPRDFSEVRKKKKPIDIPDSISPAGGMVGAADAFDVDGNINPNWVAPVRCKWEKY